MGYKGGIYSEPDQGEANHVITVTGWGKTDEGQKFWIVRNSWGTYWGENGYFRLARGINNIAIESGLCSWATPKDSWSDLSFPLQPEDYLTKGEKLAKSVYELIQK